MNFDIMKAKTIYESNVVNDCVKRSANYSETDGNSPVPNIVFEAMKTNASNPDNLKIVALNGDNPSIYVEAFEFFTFCEAINKPFDESANIIITEYAGSNPELENAEFHVVFPSECINKNILGGENLGKAVKNDWAMQLIRGCRRYGLKVNIGKESDYPEIADNTNENIKNNDESIEIKKESVEGIAGQIDNLANKTANKINKEILEREAVMNKIEAAKRAVEEYNSKRKKEKEKKYTKIKTKD